jgi:hypothetical protein
MALPALRRGNASLHFIPPTTAKSAIERNHPHRDGGFSFDTFIANLQLDTLRV